MFAIPVACLCVTRDVGNFLAAAAVRATMSASTLKTEDQRASKLGELQASFSVVDFGPCKGLGVIATRDLIEGEMLLHEEPLLRLRRDGPGQFHCTYGLGGDREKCQGVIDTLSQHSFGRGLDAAAGHYPQDYHILGVAVPCCLDRIVPVLVLWDGQLYL